MTGSFSSYTDIKTAITAVLSRVRDRVIFYVKDNTGHVTDIQAQMVGSSVALFISNATIDEAQLLADYPDAVQVGAIIGERVRVI